jgi:hypothetical protein
LTLSLFSQDETSYLYLKQRGLLVRSLCIVAHFTISYYALSTFRHSTPDSRIYPTRPVLSLSRRRKRHFPRLGIRGQSSIPHTPFLIRLTALRRKKFRYTALHTVNTALATLLLTLLASHQQCYYYLHSFWRFSQRPSDSVSRSKTLI